MNIMRFFIIGFAALCGISVNAATNDLGAIAFKGDVEGLGGRIVSMSYRPRQLVEPANSEFTVGKWSVNVMPRSIRGREWDPENPDAAVQGDIWNIIADGTVSTNSSFNFCGLTCTNKADYIVIFPKPQGWDEESKDYKLQLFTSDRWNPIGDWTVITNFPVKLHVKQVSGTNNLLLERTYIR